MRAGARVLCPARPCAREAGKQEEGERRERERVERERDLTLSFLEIFHMNSKISKNKSCSKFKILQLSFQAHFHLKLRLKVKNSNLNAKEKITLNTLFFEFFSKFCVLT